ncbi:MAG: 1-acyl-sn-glycerol-3-phosphate acyltransferase [Bacteroidales bacterium]|jgi:1-acyl-sn-glycerol-3-phosphate acyltransferase|nr:1-acyl-sn-glycerol-3-phosphate acyltransferase [Bacteroidales bacterium]SKC55626.1 Acyltransferase [Bacteroidales bacterium WCE2008]MBO7622559.1 1-acyl-sn-glycerol-3-phosphate acyltransferase [Bacteroidales bacterium]MBP5740256.1 1-acyl-sn-glycerol-3-phosphate acyltransferase [Bacteroidales bacterium]MBQ1842654.1 1-acyl-sn-glycerol-3-phosphate acyltransferase [Bacteroidales bacterium]
MWGKFCGFLLKTMGWTSDTGPAPEKKCILLGVPHTSIWDFIISYLFYRQYGIQAKCMIKKELFFWPLGPVIKAMGGVPTDRKNATTLVKSIITAMEEDEMFHLAIAPEGTRKPVKRWKTGYHLISRAVDCPVYLCYFNWGTKHIGLGPKVDLTDDAKADTEKIQALYEEMHLVGKHPKNYITH